MNDLSTNQTETKNLDSLKNLAAVVYLCQVLSFALAGLPLLIGVAINFWKKAEVSGTWLESHFNWQINTVWIALAGFALSGITFEFGIGYFILIATIVLMIYRIVAGWSALNANQAVKEE